jgi:hypothetical protein
MPLSRAEAEKRVDGFLSEASAGSKSIAKSCSMIERFTLRSNSSPILFLKAARAKIDEDQPDTEPLPAKMRRILLVHLKEAKTDEDQDRAERELRKLESGA